MTHAFLIICMRKTMTYKLPIPCSSKLMSSKFPKLDGNP